MSMNLCFETINGKHWVDFPFQTPTGLSYAVLNAKTNSERFDLIENELKKWKWKPSEISEMMYKIKTLMEDKTLKLIVI